MSSGRPVPLPKYMVATGGQLTKVDVANMRNTSRDQTVDGGREADIFISTK